MKFQHKMCPLLSFVSAFAIAASLPLIGNAQRSPEQVLASPSASAEAIYKKVAQVRRATRDIQIDGRGEDWKQIPSFTLPNTAPGPDPSRKIIRLAIAPLPDALLIMAETAGRPSLEDQAFWFTIDFASPQGRDYQLGLSANGQHSLWIYDQQGAPRSAHLTGIEWAIGDVVEVRIPYDALAQVLPTGLASQLTGTKARPWVRVLSHTWDFHTRQDVAMGPAAASFRLLDGRFPLDTPVPKGETVSSIAPPFSGTWFVAAGSSGAEKTRRFSYNLEVLNVTGRPGPTESTKTNPEYFAWGQPIHSPVAGKVLRAKGDSPDTFPYFPAAQPSSPNEVFLEIGDSMGLYLSRFREGSVSLEAGVEVAAGQKLGEAGNSGSSLYPHLNLSLWRLPEAKQTLPLAFTQVRVGLNPVEKDPWARDMANWRLQEGYFVRPLQP